LGTHNQGTILLSVKVIIMRFLFYPVWFFIYENSGGAAYCSWRSSSKYN